MERKETEEKEATRKAEKERYKMKYKVGDKVRVRSDLEECEEYGGWYTSECMVRMRGEIVTIRGVGSSAYELEESDLMWTDEMFEGLAEDELTAEEAIRLRCEMCDGRSCNDCKLSSRNNGTGAECNVLGKNHPERYIEILKQFKKDHEKKEVEVTQKIYCVVVDEERKVVHEEEIGNSDSCMDVLKNYCENHDGKFFSIMEFRYEVKQ